MRARDDASASLVEPLRRGAMLLTFVSLSSTSAVHGVTQRSHSSPGSYQNTTPGVATSASARKLSSQSNKLFL